MTPEKRAKELKDLRWLRKRKNSGSAINASARPSLLKFANGGSEVITKRWKIGGRQMSEWFRLLQDRIRVSNERKRQEIEERKRKNSEKLKGLDGA